MEASICLCISKFEYEFMGRGPKDIHAHLIDELLIVRLQGVLTAAEQQLVKILPVDNPVSVAAATQFKSLVTLTLLVYTDRIEFLNRTDSTAKENPGRV